MARFSYRIYLLSALVLLVGTATWAHAEEDGSDDVVTVEVSFFTITFFNFRAYLLFGIQGLKSILLERYKRSNILSRPIY